MTNWRHARAQFSYPWNRRHSIQIKLYDAKQKRSNVAKARNKFLHFLAKNNLWRFLCEAFIFHEKIFISLPSLDILMFSYLNIFLCSAFYFSCCRWLWWKSLKEFSSYERIRKHGEFFVLLNFLYKLLPIRFLKRGWIASCSCVTTSNYQHNNFFQLFEKLPQNAVDRWMQTNSCFHFIFSPRYPRIALSLFFRYINEEFWNKHWNPSHSLAINHFPLVKLFSWIASLIKTPAWPFKTLLSEEVWCFSSKDVEILCRVASRATSHKWESNYLIFSTQICRIQTPARFKKTNK